MNIITLNFETFYDDEYTLSKMTTEEYVRDPRFETHVLSLQLNGGRPEWVPHHYVREACLDFRVAESGALAHHAQFDGLILSHHYGIKPAFWFDTISMARLTIGVRVGNSLEALAEFYGLGTKREHDNYFKHKHWSDLSDADQTLRGEASGDNVSRTWDLFQKLAQGFPSEEYALVDSTVRMFTEPVLVGDTNLLAQIWQEEEARKREMLAELGTTGKDIRKDWVFAEMLRAAGIEPEQKRMKDGKCKACRGLGYTAASDADPAGATCRECDGTGEIERYKYAFAKTDDFMRDLLDSEDEELRLLAECKLEQHSNITQTRTGRLGWMSTRGPMCVYLNYCGAHTTRWSGGDKVNWQNRKRGGRLEHAIEAPRDHAVVVNDASQIECRILNEVAGQRDVIERFRAHADPYVALASIFYGEQIYKPEKGDSRQAEMEAKRGTGKQGELSCGYGAGGPTIKATAKKGTYGPPVHLTDEEALRLRDTYRETHPFVVNLWEQAGDVLKKINAGMEFDWHCMHVKAKRIYLPNGCPLHYETLEWHETEEKKGWRLQTRKHGWSWIYGAKLVENVIQALARLHVSQAWLRCQAAGIRMVSMEHDKLIAVVKSVDAQVAYDYMRQEMSRPPAWLPNVPLDSEGYISETFAKPAG